jgi:pilus assembly protein FimV
MKQLKPRWNHVAAASAIAVMLAAFSDQAAALALGRLNVLSALGEPLRAEIDVPQITADEAATLKASVASPEAFRAAGMEYNAALSDLQVSLQRRANGNSFLRLSSPRAITEPFVDLILEANWGAGRIVRDYTMLFDPPALRAAAPAASEAVAPPRAAAPVEPTAPRVAPAPRPPRAAPAEAGSAPAAPNRAPKPAKPPAAPTVAAPSGIKADGGNQVTVQKGDNASRIALGNKAANVSLDQMLAAMLRANPDAFISGNINRLKAGAVLEMPSESQASSLSKAEAARVLSASSKNFNQFRSGLAQAAPNVGTDAPARQATGKVQAQVDEKKPSAAAPDKLTLSKGSVQGKGVEDKLAQERAAKDAATRTAELNKNISDLSKLAAASAAASASKAAAGAASTAASGPGLAVPAAPALPAASKASASTLPGTVTNLPATSAPASAPAAATSTAASATPSVTATTATGTTATATTATAATTTPSVAASTSSAASPTAAASAAAPVASAAASAPKPAPKVVAPPPPPPPEPSFVDSLLENPLVPVGGAGILAALAGLVWYRSRKGKKSSGDDSSFLESRLQPDSFFGASGGQRVDTAEAANTGSSMVYSPSQLDAAGDVDPVAEADVYLAYGRDLQAEEILKEALRTNPQRVAIHVKLLEIYGKRRDARAFEVLANEVYAITRGTGTDWDKACELGRDIDPGNPLYQPGGQPSPGTGAAKAVATGAAAAGFGVSTQPQVQDSGNSESDLDLDLNFSLDEEIVPPSKPMGLDSLPAGAGSTQPLATQPMTGQKPQFQDSDVDFDIETLRTITSAAPIASAPVPVAPASAALVTPSPSPAPAMPAAADAAKSGMIEFDISSISLDLGGPSTQQPDDPSETGDPLQTKLDLANEFQSIGDTDGARALVQEVLAEATGAMKAKAQKMLVDLG